MERRVVTGLCVALVLAGCGSAAPVARPSPSLSPSPTSTPSPRPSATHSASSSPTRVRPSSSPTIVPTTPPPPTTPRLPSCPTPAWGPVTAAPGLGKTVALTFDDGASVYTPQILAVLARFHVHATFFDTGLADSRYPQYARAVVAAGDVLGNHTWDHPKNWGYRYYSTSFQRWELTRTSAVQAPIIGHAPCLMRPPGGAYDSSSLALVRSLGMSLVMWSTSGEDWRQPPYLSTSFQQTILRNVEAGARRAHPIILLHAGKASHEPDCQPSGCLAGQVSSYRGNTVAVLPAIIRFYLARGYRFVVLR